MTAATTPLVGREPELRRLERPLADVDAGTTHALALWGEPGIGKSRLLGEIGERAAARGHLGLAGRAAELERDLPYALWIDALDQHVAGPGAVALASFDESELSELAVAVPAVERVTGAAPADRAERHRVARAVRELLDRLAVARPLALLLDDVHWADPASVDVLVLLLHRPTRNPLLLALAARSSRAPALDAAFESATRRGAASVVEVGPLPREAADHLLPAALGPAARARLYRESGGNPFYLEALGRAPVQRQPPAAAGAPGVPRAIMAALAGEIAALAPDAQLLAQGGAVAGDPFDPALAAAAADLDEPHALDALDALQAADLVRSTEHPRRFRFRHPLVRRAVYEHAGGGWKLAAHARAAQALAARGATVAERAHHVERAAHPGDLAAVELLTVAAQQTATTAPATAADWYETALRLLPQTREHAERRLALLGDHAVALTSAGRASEARDVLRRLLRELPGAAVRERVEATVALAELEALWTQRPHEARRLLETERANLGDLDPGAAAALTLAMASERTEYGDHVASEALADEAARGARAAGDRVLEADAAALAADGAHCRLRGDDPEALAAVDRKIAEAGRLVDALPDEEAARRLRMVLEMSVSWLFTGHLPAARAAGERGLRIARRTRQGLMSPAFLSVCGFVDYELGRLDDAEAAEDEALESAMLSGNVQVEYWASILLSQVAASRGRVDEALGHGRRAWDILGTREYSQAGYAVAGALLQAGDPHGALDVLETFGWVRPELWTFDRLRAADVVVRALLAAGRVDEAEAWARRVPLEGGGRRSGMFGAAVARCQAGVLLARGAAAEAAAVALGGAEEGARGHAALWAARCRTLAGEALAAAGRGDDAREQLRRVAADLEARGAWGERDAALRILRRLGERPRPAPATIARLGDDRLAALTRREHEVAGLVAEGHTNAQIAARLQLSERTVEKHVSRALAKLGMSSRAGLVRLLAERR